MAPGPNCRLLLDPAGYVRLSNWSRGTVIMGRTRKRIGLEFVFRPPEVRGSRSGALRSGSVRSSMLGLMDVGNKLLQNLPDSWKLLFLTRLIPPSSGHPPSTGSFKGSFRRAHRE
jgi:hypothetical protein